MRKCPFCKAQIEDNARFCLYCMKTLNEKEVIRPTKNKKPWWLLIVAGALVLALLLAVLLILKGQEEMLGDIEGGETTASSQSTGSETAENTGETPQETQPEETGTMEPPQTGTSNTGKTPEESQDDVPEPSENENPVTVPTRSTDPTTPTKGPTPPAAPEETTVETTQPEETTAATTEPETQPVAVTYTYRAARAGDDLNANYTNSGNDIVITGVAQQSADGVYDIPAYIDGKRVIAIVANAFSGSNARIVYVPATLKNIWNYAFYGCNLTDIYFRGSAIHVESKAFSSALTIHCASTCNDRNFRYFKNSAAIYGATWEEWNG